MAVVLLASASANCDSLHFDWSETAPYTHALAEDGVEPLAATSATVTALTTSTATSASTATAAEGCEILEMEDDGLLSVEIDAQMMQLTLKERVTINRLLRQNNVSATDPWRRISRDRRRHGVLEVGQCAAHRYAGQQPTNSVR